MSVVVKTTREYVYDDHGYMVKETTTTEEYEINDKIGINTEVTVDNDNNAEDYYIANGEATVHGELSDDFKEKIRAVVREVLNHHETIYHNNFPKW